MGWCLLGRVGVPGDARGEQRRLAAAVITGCGLPGGGGLLEGLAVPGDEVHELRGRVGGDRVGVLLVLSSIGSALRSQMTWTVVHPVGVSTSETDTIWQWSFPAVW